jgi:hypothetical protein
MSLDERLREGLPRIAEGAGEEVEPALRGVVERGRRRRTAYRIVGGLAAAAVVAGAAVATPRVVDALRGGPRPIRPAGPTSGEATMPPPGPGVLCSDPVPFRPTYLPEGFSPQAVSGPAPGAPPAEPRQYVVHWTDGERAFEVRRPGTLFLEIGGEDGGPTITVLGQEVIPAAPVEPMGDDYIVQFRHPADAPRAEDWSRDCALYSIDEHGLPPAELERVAEGLRPA